MVSLPSHRGQNLLPEGGVVERIVDISGDEMLSLLLLLPLLVMLTLILRAIVLWLL
jgi:hypothetical protein